MTRSAILLRLNYTTTPPDGWSLAHWKAAVRQAIVAFLDETDWQSVLAACADVGIANPAEYWTQADAQWLVEQLTKV